MFATRHYTLLLSLAGLFAGCAASQPWVPLAPAPAAPPELTLVWVGRGECERYAGGTWVRAPEFDYDFNVEQRRYGDHWESVKSMRRRHPAYDGSAGPRAQTYFFNLAFQAPDGSGQVAGELTSSLGRGQIRTDREFRESELDFLAEGVSSFAPFDRYRIRQRYDYEGGQLTETVELNLGEQPWVRNREVATLFGGQHFPGAPTRR